jgi:MFS transporter, DHA1 family, multidrug resistance protein
MQRYILLLLSLVLLSPLGIDLYLPTLPQIAAGLDTSLNHIQTTIPLFLLMMGLGQLVSGPLADNYGRKPIALAGVVCYIFGSIIAATATNWWVFLFARLIQRIAVCCTAVTAFSGVRDRLEGDAAARAFGFLNGALNIVPALAPLLGGFLASHWGWQAPFWFLSCYAAITGLAICFLLPETRPANSLQVALFPLNHYFAILKYRQFLIFALAISGAMGMILSYVSLAPEVLMRAAGLNAFCFALVFGINGIWIMLVSILVNQIIRKIGRPICLLSGASCILLAAVCLLLQPLLLATTQSNHWLAYMLPVAIGVAGLAFVIGPCTSYALAAYRQQAGVAAALLGFLQMAGGASLSLLILAVPIPPKAPLAIILLVAATLSYFAWQLSKRVPSELTALPSD